MRREVKLMDSITRRHRIIVGLLLFCVAIEALTLYPIFNVFVVAVPTGMFGLSHCLNAIVR
jgi:hypothetical protein